ncbi:type IV pilus inner membrane component PilO [Hydrogenophaga aquatica]
MPKKTKKTSIDFAEIQQKLRAQFTDLDPNDPSLWPDLPRYLLLIALAVVVVVALWFAWISGYEETLAAEERREVQLKEEYTGKLGQAVNLEPLKAQLEQVQQYVTQLEKQLPSKAEMDQLLSDINQAGLGRSLQFELFRPGTINMHEYYAELPIAVRVSGSYSDIGLFASDIAHLSRIVTLNNITLAPVANRPDVLTMDATAKTFRYLDPEELLAQQKAKAAGGKK